MAGSVGTKRRVEADFMFGERYPAKLTSVTFTQNTATADGGGLYITGSGSCELDDCTFDDNEASSSGGAVYVYSGSLVARQSHFTNNQAGYYGGGAIAALSYGTLLIDGCEFTTNQAGYYGGAICTWAPSVISHSTFTNNTATYWGGAICNLSGAIQIASSEFEGNRATSGLGGALYNSVAATVLQCTFRSNQAAGNGGAIYTIEDDSPLSIAQCLFEQNAAGTGGSGSGGAIWTSQRRVEIAASIVRQNTAADDGGGIFVAEGLVALTDSLVAANTATNGRGGGIFVDATAELDFANSTMSGNSAKQAGGGFYFNGVANTVRLVHATIANNRADAAGQTGQAGGGIYSASTQDPAAKHDRRRQRPRDRHHGLRRAGFAGSDLFVQPDRRRRVGGRAGPRRQPQSGRRRSAARAAAGQRRPELHACTAAGQPGHRCRRQRQGPRTGWRAAVV